MPAILWGGLVAGTIDIGAAAIITGLNPVFVMKIVAGGLLGRSAFEGGWPVAVLGMALQWAMSIVIAAIFVLAARRLAVLVRRWLAAGLTYGVVVYFVMNYLVVPLSAIGKGLPAFDPVKFSENMAAMLLFGLIVAFVGQYFLRNAAAR
jgi:uncharacterized membrane protein YagU involved in acid resistance